MKNLLIVSLLLVVSASTVVCQEVKQRNIQKFLIKEGIDSTQRLARLSASPLDQTAQWPEVLYYETPYTATLLGTSSIPVSFSRLEFKDGDTRLGSVISLGYGYTWFFGDFTFEKNDKIVIDPQFFFGLGADVGIKNDFDSNKITSSFVTGAFFGFKAVSIFGGYDFLSKSWTMGLGTKIDLYNISKSAFKPYGRVMPVREPHSKAEPIEN